jgi:hypothetical protein
MSPPRALLRSLLFALPAVAGGCNLVLGISGGTPEASSGHGGAASSSATSTSSVASSSVASSGATGGGGGGACAPDRTPPCDADGGACTPVLIDTEVDADDLAMSGDFVFFTSGDGDSIRRVRYDGSGAIGISAGNATTHLTIQGNHVYWTDYYGGSTVKGCALDGSGLTTVAVMDMSQQIGNGLIAADTTGAMVYWTTYSPPGLFRTTTDGTQQSASVVLQQNAAQHVDAPTGVALDATYLYWGDSDGVRRMLISAIGTANPPIEDFAVDATAPVSTVILDADRVYWITQTGDVRSKAKTDPPAVTAFVHLSGSADQPMGIALDASSVYWVTLSGAVQKAGKTGATVIPVASGPPLQADSAGGIAVDCGAVYWAVPASGMGMGQVYKAAKGPG